MYSMQGTWTKGPKNTWVYTVKKGRTTVYTFKVGVSKKGHYWISGHNIKKNIHRFRAIKKIGIKKGMSFAAVKKLIAMKKNLTILMKF